MVLWERVGGVLEEGCAEKMCFIGFRYGQNTGRFVVKELPPAPVTLS